MKREFFNVQFAAMVSAYTIADKLSDEASDVYFEMLKDIPHASFERAVKLCLAKCRYIPTIAELGAAACGGNERWYEGLIEDKRRAFERRAKQLEAPIADDVKRENQRKILDLANSFTGNRRRAG